MTGSGGLVVSGSESMALVLPAYLPSQVKEMMKAYQDMCEAVIDKKTDIQVISGKEHKKKSACRKLDVAYNISHGEDFLVDKMVVLPDGEIGFKIRVIAVHPKTGRTAIGDGWCDTIEKPLNYIDKYGEPQTRKLHDLRGTASTRAMNRATLNLVGMGEVSAEEMSGHHSNGKPQGKISASTDPVDKPTWEVKKWCERQGVDSHYLAKYKDDKEHTTSRGGTYHWYKGIPSDLWNNGPGKDSGAVGDSTATEVETRPVNAKTGDPWEEDKPEKPEGPPSEQVGNGGEVKEKPAKPQTFPGPLDFLSEMEIAQLKRKAKKSGTDLGSWLPGTGLAESPMEIPREKAAEIRRRLDALAEA